MVSYSKTMQCSICLEEGADFSICTNGHLFHRDCLKDWFITRRSCVCPLCQQKGSGLECAELQAEVFERDYYRLLKKEIEAGARLNTEVVLKVQGDYSNWAMSAAALPFMGNPATALMASVAALVTYTGVMGIPEKTPALEESYSPRLVIPQDRDKLLQSLTLIAIHYERALLNDDAGDLLGEMRYLFVRLSLGIGVVERFSAAVPERLQEAGLGPFYREAHEMTLRRADRLGKPRSPPWAVALYLDENYRAFIRRN